MVWEDGDDWAESVCFYLLFITFIREIICYGYDINKFRYFTCHLVKKWFPQNKKQSFYHTKKWILHSNILYDDLKWLETQSHVSELEKSLN